MTHTHKCMLKSGHWRDAHNSMLHLYDPHLCMVCGPHSLNVLHTQVISCLCEWHSLMVIHVVQYLYGLMVLCAVLPTHLDGDTQCVTLNFMVLHIVYEFNNVTLCDRLSLSCYTECVIHSWVVLHTDCVPDSVNCVTQSV